MECDDIKVEIDASQYNDEDQDEDEEEEEEEPLSVAYMKYRAFEEFTLQAHTAVATGGDGDDSSTLDSFVRAWEARLAGALAVGCAYSDTVLAFKLLERLCESRAEALAAALDRLEAASSQATGGGGGEQQQQQRSLLVRVKELGNSSSSELAAGKEGTNNEDEEIKEEEELVEKSEYRYFFNSQATCGFYDEISRYPYLKF
jgi:hypothetical protein